MLKLALDSINSSLEEKSWFIQENFLDDDLCQGIINSYIDEMESGPFLEAKVGKGISKSKNINIRNGSIQWIEHWGENRSLELLNTMFLEIMTSMNHYFHICLKRFESQFAIYNKGGFYKIHLDQHRVTRHRQISCCLYLNDCIDGGELVLYEKGSRTKIVKIIKPLKGSLVLFFSADIHHEVRLVNVSRYSITTWFRDDEIIPFI